MLPVISSHDTFVECRATPTVFCMNSDEFLCSVLQLLTVFLLLVLLSSSQAFKPVVGKNLLSPVTAVEFLLDRQLDFLSDHSACQPYQVMFLSPL